MPEGEERERAIERASEDFQRRLPELLARRIYDGLPPAERAELSNTADRIKLL